MPGSKSRQSLITAVAIKRPLTPGFRLMLGFVTLLAIAAAAVAWHSEKQHRRAKHSVSSLSTQKLGVIVEMSGEATEANVTKAKDIAMHVAAMDPKYLESSQVSTDDLDKEREIARKQLLEEGKSEAIVEKILVGKMNKFYEDNCLVNQIFVKAVAKETVAQYAGDIKVLSFKRYKVGEGIEVEVVDFAAEVAAQLNA